MKTFFENKNYTSIMFLAITITSILLLFTFVDFVQDVDEGITAYAIAQQNDSNPLQANENITEEQTQGKIYTVWAWSIFYIIVVVIIVLVAILLIILKRTVQGNIKEEDEKQEEIV